MAAANGAAASSAPVRSSAMIRTFLSGTYPPPEARLEGQRYDAVLPFHALKISTPSSENSPS